MQLLEQHQRLPPPKQFEAALRVPDALDAADEADQYAAIGNAVSPPVVEALCGALLGGPAAGTRA